MSESTFRGSTLSTDTAHQDDTPTGLAAIAAGFVAALMLQDLTLAQAAASASGAATPLGAHAARLYQALVEAGEGARDLSAMFPYLARAARQEVT